MWPLFTTTAAYAMNTFASEALNGFSLFQLVFVCDPPDLTSLSFPKIDTIPVVYREYNNLLLARARMGLFKVLQKYGLKISSHKCQFFKRKIVYMALEFQIKDSKVCYTSLKDKCEAIRNLESPKILKQEHFEVWLISCHHSFSIYNVY